MLGIKCLAKEIEPGRSGIQLNNGNLILSYSKRATLRINCQCMCRHTDRQTKCTFLSFVSLYCLIAAY